MAYALSPLPKFQAIDADGNPIAGGLVHTYAAGTTTPLATYSNDSGTANTNPIVLDAAGRATIYLTSGTAYKFVVINADDTLAYTQDNIEITIPRDDFVESVTGLNTDNADPQNPIVRVSVDGDSISGLGTPGSPLSWVPQSPATLSTFAPFTTTAATYTVGAEDFQVIANRAGTVTLTLPTASTNTGRMLLIRTIQAQTVVSATSNVVPIDGAAAGTAILAATDGAWAVVQSNGTNWLISESGGTGGGGGGMSIGGAVTSGTAASVLFVDTGPVLAQDNANFFWDTTAKQLNVGVGAILYGDTHSNIFLTDLGKPSGISGADTNTAMGSGALQGLTSAANNAVFGAFAGLSITSGPYNTMIGAETDCTATGNNQTSLGKGATCTGSDQITLGNTDVMTLRCQQISITALSDRRDKTHIEEIPLGLSFIEDITPVRFIWAVRGREGPTIAKYHGGFIAQDLLETSQAHDAEWLGLVDTTNPDRLEATPGRLFPVLVKAIQELSAKVKRLEEEASG